MSPVAELTGKDLYLSDFAECKDQLSGRALPWLRDLREAAITGFAAVGFPTIRNEDWKYTNVGPLTRIPFRPAVAGNGRGQAAAKGSAKGSAAVPFANAGFTQVVFVDGIFSAERSHIDGLSKRIVIKSLREAFDSDPREIEKYLGHHTDHRREPFAALNTAFFNDGAFVRLPRSCVLPEPIHLVFLSSGREEPMIVHPRNLIVAEPGSAATIIEHYIGTPGRSGGDGRAYFTNAVTEIVAADAAGIAHYRLQEEDESAYHMGAVAIHQGRDSKVSSQSLSLGAHLARIEIRAVIAGQGADCELSGLYLGRGRQHVDHHTLIDHAEAHGTSRELFKGILAGASRGVFTGRIIVREGAQKTSAHQTNRNLLLSDQALADTRPQLEILNNDVACTHGATIGQLDPEQVFYLRSRGIGADQARGLLTYAFASEVLGSIGVEEVRKAMNAALFSWMEGIGEGLPAGGGEG